MWRQKPHKSTLPSSQRHIRIKWLMIKNRIVSPMSLWMPPRLQYFQVNVSEALYKWGRTLPRAQRYLGSLRYRKVPEKRRNGHDSVFDLHCCTNSGTFGISSKGPYMCAVYLEWVPLQLWPQWAFSFFHFPENTSARLLKMHFCVEKRYSGGKETSMVFRVIRYTLTTKIRCILFFT